METFEIPRGSKILKESSPRGDVTLYWFKPDGSIVRYFIGFFILAWMGGWVIGFTSALGEILNKPEVPNGFLLFWIVGWTLGGCFAAYYLYLILRPQKPERLVLHSDSLEYDIGTSSPVSAMFNRRYAYNPVAQWSQFFQKRKVFPRFQRGDIKFVHEKNPSRIYFDWESKRYEVGTGLSEPDIDWLYSQLSSWSKV